MSLTFCKLTDSRTIFSIPIAISRLSADTVNNTYYFFKCVCRRASFRNTGPLNSPFTSRTHWHPFATPNYNNLSVLFRIFTMTTQKITSVSECPCASTCIKIILIILINIPSQRSRCSGTCCPLISRPGLHMSRRPALWICLNAAAGLPASSGTFSGKPGYQGDQMQRIIII